ncbi:MAG TPA: Crp/Fnr family transcriptional regulator [Burkholderiales bacterium]|nr:Crp/Fnr family transcriptional regulator [Burkholderiales bacterium]
MTTSMNDLLGNVPLFSGLQAEELAAMGRVAVGRNFAKHAIILHEGDKTDALYVIASGKVKVILSTGGGKEVILAILGKSEFFGEMALLDQQPRSADVVAMEPTQLFAISKADFVNCLAHNPQMAFKIIQGLIQRLRSADRKIQSLALMDVYGRVARTLLELAKPENGKMIVGEKLSQQDLADMIGASREMVSRILKDLAVSGHIRFEARRIIVNEGLPEKTASASKL